MPVKGCRGSEVDDRHLNGGGRLNHQCHCYDNISNMKLNSNGISGAEGTADGGNRRPYYAIATVTD